jgi:predicted membrane metal-binding protein
LLRGGRYFVAFRKAAWIALAGIATYTVFVGAEASVVRAVAMGTLFVIAIKFLVSLLSFPLLNGISPNLGSYSEIGRAKSYSHESGRRNKRLI